MSRAMRVGGLDTNSANSNNAMMVEQSPYLLEEEQQQHHSGPHLQETPLQGSSLATNNGDEGNNNNISGSDGLLIAGKGGGVGSSATTAELTPSNLDLVNKGMPPISNSAPSAYGTRSSGVAAVGSIPIVGSTSSRGRGASGGGMMVMSSSYNNQALNNEIVNSYAKTSSMSGSRPATSHSVLASPANNNNGTESVAGSATRTATRASFGGMSLDDLLGSNVRSYLSNDDEFAKMANQANLDLDEVLDRVDEHCYSHQYSSAPHATGSAWSRGGFSTGSRFASGRGMGGGTMRRASSHNEITQHTSSSILNSSSVDDLEHLHDGEYTSLLGPRGAALANNNSHHPAGKTSPSPSGYSSSAYTGGTSTAADAMDDGSHGGYDTSPGNSPRGRGVTKFSALGGGGEGALMSRRRKKGVKGLYNEVKEVTVFEADDQVHIQITFKRNFWGWMFWFLAFVEGTLWDTMNIFLISEGGVGGKGYNPASLGFWACAWKVPVFFLVLLMAYLGGSFDPDCLQAFRNKKLTALLIGTGVMSTVGIFLQVMATIVQPGTPHFSPMINMGLLTMLLWRIKRKIPTFFQEWFGVALAMIGYTLASWQQYTDPAIDKLIGSNLLQLAAGVSIGAWAILVEWCNLNSPAILVTYIPFVFTDLVMFGLGGLLTNVTKLGQTDFFTGFSQQEPILWGLAVGTGGMIEMLLYLAVARSLDVLSLAAIFALKTICVPYTVHWLLKLNQESDHYKYWTSWLFIGTPFVIIGTGGLAFFASVKREFVERRIRLMDPKRVANPYLRDGGPSIPADPPTVLNSSSTEGGHSSSGEVSSSYAPTSTTVTAQSTLGNYNNNNNNTSATLSGGGGRRSSSSLLRPTTSVSGARGGTRGSLGVGRGGDGGDIDDTTSESESDAGGGGANYRNIILTSVASGAKRTSVGGRRAAPASTGPVRRLV